MDNSRFGFLVIGGLLIVIAGLSLFTVNEREQAIKDGSFTVDINDEEPKSS